MVRRADRDRVDAGVAQEFTEVPISFHRRRSVAAGLSGVVLLYPFFGHGQALGIQVAHGDHAGDIVFEDARHIHFVGDPATPDLADMDLIARRICAKHGRRNNHRQRNSSRSAGHR